MSRTRRSQQRRGQAVVEFALVVPIFILVLIGLFDFGRAIYAYNTVQNASREAVRLGIVDQNMTAIRNEAVGMAVGLGVPAANVDVAILQPDYATGGTGTCAVDPDLGCVMRVRVHYDYVAATPIIGNLVGTFRVTGETHQPIERAYSSP